MKYVCPQCICLKQLASISTFVFFNSQTLKLVVIQLLIQPDKSFQNNNSLQITSSLICMQNFSFRNAYTSVLPRFLPYFLPPSPTMLLLCCFSQEASSYVVDEQIQNKKTNQVLDQITKSVTAEKSL